MTREQWLNEFVEAARGPFMAAGHEIPSDIRVSVGLPSAGFRSKAIGEVWARENSGSGHHEIFISPKLEDPSLVAAVLTHELAHTVAGMEAKHGPKFKRIFEDVGLVGKATATEAGDMWHAWADAIVARLGDFPHSAITGTTAKKKQSTRLLKLECDTCGMILRGTAKWLDGKVLRCPDMECEGMLHLDGAEGGSDETFVSEPDQDFIIDFGEPPVPEDEPEWSRADVDEVLTREIDDGFHDREAEDDGGHTVITDEDDGFHYIHGPDGERVGKGYPLKKTANRAARRLNGEE